MLLLSLLLSLIAVTAVTAAFMVLKIVVCIVSDCVENVFSVRLVDLGGRRGPVMMTSAPIVVYGQ